MRKVSLWFFVAGLVCALGFAVPANAQQEAKQFPVVTKTLKNGMKVLVQSDHSIPNVALYIFYRIGSRNEHPGTTGLSHFFEHMMFNGAKKYGPGELDKVMEANGGENNAYTTQNTTVYQDWFPRSALPLIFDIEADRIQYLQFDPKKIASEREVVASERRLRTDNDNGGLLDEQLWATAFIAHPYQWPVVGWMSDIEHWTMEDLKHHFEMGYSPNNATMVVVGDVTSDEIFQLCEKYIEPIPTHAPPPPVTTVEPDQLGERRLVVHKPAELPLLEIAYHVPQTNNPDFYALNILQTVLVHGESSRMYQRLVDKDQIALNVDMDAGPAFDPTLVIVNAQPKQGVDPAACEKAIYEELDKAKTGLISDLELEKAKNIRLVQFYQQMRTISGRANTIGTYEVFFGDYNRLFDAAKNYSAVTKEDVQRVARKYFGANNRTVATLIPENEEKAKQ
ncbi:MAG: insulinase family protein [Acidobacteria bacterium]|nr:insulinase family protein [Acidobacteriota bacterium]MBS1865058.1 insulinase family protein [Acidobacteriota bacterium]